MAPPLPPMAAVHGLFYDPASTAASKKRDLSYDVGRVTENWNPKEWNWDSVRFMAKPSGTVTSRGGGGGGGEDGEGLGLKLNLGGANKRVRSGSPGTASYPMCQVDNCGEDLTRAKDYHRRHKVCEAHSKASKALVGDQMQRFCQQCSRFHPLPEFDEGKRSCRRRLAGHNRRRRKTQPEDVASTTVATASPAAANLEIFNLLTAAITGGSQGKFEERRSQVPDKEQLVQILNRIPLPADLTAKLLDVGNVNAKSDQVPMQTSPSYSHHDNQLNHTPSAPLTKDLLGVLSTTLSTPSPSAVSLHSQNGSLSSNVSGDKSRTSADHTRGQQFTGVGGERSSGSSQSPVEDSDSQEDVRVNLPLQLFSSSPEDESLPKKASSRKYFSSDSSNPMEERSPTSSPPIVEMQFGLRGGDRVLKPESISSARGGNANKEANRIYGCDISLDLFKGSNNRIQQPSSLRSVPFQAGYTSSSSDHSPPSLNSDAQDRTGRIMFKLFDKHPSHFPRTLRTQIYNWLSNRPSDLESYIRPGCVVLSIYATMSSSAWEQLEENFLQHVHSLIQNSDSDFWRGGRFLVHCGSQLASHKDGKIRLCKPWRTWRSPELISASPLAIVSGQETTISLKGRNLSTPGTKVHCTGTGCYTTAEVTVSAYPGMAYEEIKLDGFKVQNAIPGILGRCFIEVENGFKGNSFPLIIADSTICKELKPLESEFYEEKTCDAISEEHEYHFGRPRSREEALHFLNELGWLFQRQQFLNVHEGPDYSLNRFKYLLTFSVERNCCMLVKTLLDILVKEHTEGEWLSTRSMEMLNAIQLLNRAVKRKYTGMIDLLIHYSVPCKNDTSRMYVFPPNLEGPGGITPLHLAACTSSSEGLIDSLTNDPQEIGLKCWESLADANGQTPHAYAMMRNNHSYNELVARKLADRQRGEISLRIDTEIEQQSFRVELVQKQSNQLQRGENSCAKCAIAETHYNRRISGSKGWLHRPFIHSILAIAAVCVCVCVFFRGTPFVGSEGPFRWENLDYGTM